MQRLAPRETTVKIAVISDMHLGRGDGTDLFGHRDADFVRFLKHLEDNHERVILLGDIYETFASDPWHQYREVKLIRAAHPEVVKRFEDDKYTLIHGNHDLVMSRFGAPSELMLDLDGTRILFRHGHKYDWLIRNAPTIPEFFVWLGFILARWGVEAFLRWGNVIDQWLRANEGMASFQNWALSTAAANSADVIVTGHTHRGAAKESGNRMYMNSGACYKGLYSWLHLDTGTGTFLHNTGW